MLKAMKKENVFRVGFFLVGAAVCYGTIQFLSGVATVEVWNQMNTHAGSVRLVCVSENLALESLQIGAGQRFEFHIPVGTEGSCVGEYKDSQGRSFTITNEDLGYMEGGKEYFLVLTDKGADQSEGF